MRRLAAVLVLVASACADGGVVIEVSPSDPSVDSVRLFLGRPDRTEGATLDVPIGTGPNGLVRSEVTGVTRFPRDANNELDVQAVKAGGKVKFVLVRDEVVDLGAVVAVGYAGQQIREVATLFDVHLPATRFDKYSLTLAAPARPPVAWSDRSPVPATEATCIGITDPATKDPFSVSYIVTPGDQDCDGLAADNPAECNNNAWFGKRPASLEELTCLTGDAVQPSCYLGGPECNDGQTPMPNQCLPTQYCVPKPVCNACAGKLSCAQDITTNPTASIFGFGFDCPLTLDGGNTCEDELVLTMGPIDGLNCTAAQIGDATHEFADHIDLPEQSIYVKIDDGCRIRLQVKGKAPGTNTSAIGLMIAVDLENGHGIAVPIVLKIDRAGGLCEGRPKQCGFDAAALGPSLLDCATSWSTPMTVPDLVPPGATNVRSPTLTSDGLELFFVTDDSTVWHSVRTSRIDAWKPPQMILVLSTPNGENAKTTIARISPDGETMYLSSTRTPTLGGSDLFVARRSGAQWSQPMPVLGMVNTQNDETGAAVDGTDAVLVFDRAVDNMTPTRKLFVATRAPGSTSPWPAGTQVPGTGPNANDSNPHITEHANGIYFATDAFDTAGLELIAVERGSPTTGTTLGLPRRLTALSSPQDESDPWVSADQREIYFASNRTGAWRIYRATR